MYSILFILRQSDSYYSYQHLFITQKVLSVPPRMPKKQQLEKRQSDSSTDDDTSVHEMDLTFQRYMWDRRWRKLSKYGLEIFTLERT